MHDELRAIGATVIERRIHYFEPTGLSIVAILAESHASLHTYPEHGVYMLDVFTCGDLDAAAAARSIAARIGGSSTLQLIKRGV